MSSQSSDISFAGGINGSVAIGNPTFTVFANQTTDNSTGCRDFTACIATDDVASVVRRQSAGIIGSLNIDIGQP